MNETPASSSSSVSDQPNAQALGQAIAEHFARGGTLGDLRGLKPEHYEAIYAVGHNLYAQTRYDEALKVFTFLVANEPFDRRFQFALASVNQMLGRYEQAVMYYSMGSMFDLQDPIPTFHTGECLLALGHRDEAREAFEMVVKQSTRIEQTSLSQRAQAMLELLSATLGQPGQDAGKNP